MPGVGPGPGPCKGDGFYSEHLEELHYILVTADDRIIVHRRIKSTPRRVPQKKKFLVIGNILINR